MTSQHVEYSTPPWLVAALAAGALVALAAATRAAPAGRFFALVLAVVTGGEALRSLVLRPTVYADARGVQVVRALSRERFAWSEVTGIAALAPPSGGGRLRRRAAALEIDLGDRLVVVPAYRLGAPVDEVVERLNRSWGGSPGS